MKNIIALLILIFPFAGQAQYTISGRIVDMQTDKPVPFVNVSVEGLDRGTVSDEYGYFKLVLDKRERTVTLSAVAYETESFRAADLAFGSRVRFTPKIYELDVVEIKAPRLSDELVILGRRNKRRGHSVGFGSRQLGTEIGSGIRVKEKYYIESAHFVLNHASGDSLLFRLNLYDFSEGVPGSKLINRDIIIRTNQSRGTIDVDLTAHNLIVSDDIFMALEWIKDDGGKGNEGITFDTRKGGKMKGIYLKSTSGKSFDKLGYKKRLAMCFYLKAKKVLD